MQHTLTNKSSKKCQTKATTATWTYQASGARLLLIDKQRLALLHHLFAELGLVQHNTQQPPLVGDGHLVPLAGLLHGALVGGRVMLGVGAALHFKGSAQQRLLLETHGAHKVIGAAEILAVLFFLVATLVVEHERERILELCGGRGRRVRAGWI